MRLFPPPPPPVSMLWQWCSPVFNVLYFAQVSFVPYLGFYKAVCSQLAWFPFYILESILVENIAEPLECKSVRSFVVVQKNDPAFHLSPPKGIFYLVLPR